MSGAERMVSSVAELLEAAAATDLGTIIVRGELSNVPGFQLRPGRRLCGEEGACLRFAAGQDGVRLTADNTVDRLDLRTDVDRAAVTTDPEVDGFGCVRLEHLRVHGCVRLIAEGAAVGGNVHVDDLHILEADARGAGEGPRGFGVEVTRGAFTLWNRQASPEHRIGAEIRGLAAGRPGTPVHGTAVLLGGTPDGGETTATILETMEIHSDGGIAPGAADRISGGVFVVQGAHVKEVRNAGPVTTYGANDMVLDNWGRVDRWRALGDLLSLGANGIGFVNLGQLGTLSVEGVLETRGAGACGFNSGEVSSEPAAAPANAVGAQAVAGAVQEAVFERIVTRGDGAIGVQVSVPAGRIAVRRGIETFGGVGASLARGVVIRIAAAPFAVRAGGSVEVLDVEGGLTVHGADIPAIELAGPIGAVSLKGALGPSTTL